MPPSGRAGHKEFHRVVIHGFLAVTLLCVFRTSERAAYLLQYSSLCSQVSMWPSLACIIVLPAPMCTRVGHFYHPLESTAEKLIALVK